MSRTILQVILVICLVVVASVAVIAQTPTSSLTPAEQARIKPLVAEETKAREALNAKIATLPEAKTFQSAQDAVKKADEALAKIIPTLKIKEAVDLQAARDALQKALDDLNKAVEKLPENAAWKEAGAKSLDLAYQIMAEHKLSSREFKPELNPQGDLVFTKLASVTPPKP